jgi:hypothetical protein
MIASTRQARPSLSIGMAINSPTSHIIYRGQMSRFLVAFQNCTNLFPAGFVQRAPATPAAVRAKIAALASSIVKTVGLPNIFAFSEIYSLPLAQKLMARMNLPGHSVLFRPSQAPNETGLGIAYDPGLFRPVSGSETTDLAIRGSNRRPRWYAVLFEITAGNRGTFWLVVNHWKSQRSGQLATDSDRQESAFLLGDFFMSRARAQSEAMIMIGDFNCEPGDRPFYTQSQRLLRGPGRPNAIQCVRERGHVLRDRNRLAYFHNMMWRFMAEPASLNQTSSPNYVPMPGYHMGTHGPALNGPIGQPGWAHVRSIDGFQADVTRRHSERR